MKKSSFYCQFNDTKKSTDDTKTKYQDVKGMALSEPAVQRFLSQFNETKKEYYKNLLIQAHKDKELENPHNQYMCWQPK